MISSVESPPSTGCSVISAMTTLAPSPAKPMAIARPMPELAPVTTAIFPASRLDIGFDPTLSPSDSNYRDPGDWSTLPARICRSEEHTSELQSRGHLVCRLLLEK